MTAIPNIQDIEKSTVISQVSQVFQIKKYSFIFIKYHFGISEFNLRKICMYEEPQYLFVRAQRQQGT